MKRTWEKTDSGRSGFKLRLDVTPNRRRNDGYGKAAYASGKFCGDWWIENSSQFDIGIFSLEQPSKNLDVYPVTLGRSQVCTGFYTSV